MKQRIIIKGKSKPTLVFSTNPVKIPLLKQRRNQELKTLSTTKQQSDENIEKIGN